MAHVRKQIRDSAQSILKNYPDLAAIVNVANITQGRVKAFQKEDIHSGADSQFPAINIHTQDDTPEQSFITGCSKYESVQVLAIEVYTNLNDGYEDELDRVCVQVEKAIANSPKLGFDDTSTLIQYRGSSSAKEMSEQLFAARLLRYDIHFKVNHTDPETLI